MSSSAANGVSGLTLRVKCKKSQAIVMRNVDPELTVDIFLIELSELTDVPHDRMALLKGFPPRRVCYTFEMTVREIGVVNQDTLIVELDTSGDFPGGTMPTDEELAEIRRVPVVPVVVPVKEPVLAAVKTPPKIEFIKMNSPASAAHADSGASSSSNLGVVLSADLNGIESESSVNVPLGPSQATTSFGQRQAEQEFPQGIILRKTVPSDNSCMFSSVQFTISGHLEEDIHGRVSSTASKHMRDIIASAVRADTVKYCEAFLGRTNSDYYKWIQKYESWGGGIELAILSEYYLIEINVMDTQHNRMNRFGEDKNYTNRVFLIYDGIHYDPLYMESYDGSKVTTQFSSQDTAAYEQVMELGREAQASHQFTDLRNFTLMCSICRAKFVGQEEAQAHAEQTKHDKFEETM